MFPSLEHYRKYKKAEHKLREAFTHPDLLSFPFGPDTLLGLWTHKHVIPNYRIVETFSREDTETCQGIDLNNAYPSQAVIAESFYKITGDRCEYSGGSIIDENLYYFDVLESHPLFPENIARAWGSNLKLLTKYGLKYEIKGMNVGMKVRKATKFVQKVLKQIMNDDTLDKPDKKALGNCTIGWNGKIKKIENAFTLYDDIVDVSSIMDCKKYGSVRYITPRGLFVNKQKIKACHMY